MPGDRYSRLDEIAERIKSRHQGESSYRDWIAMGVRGAGALVPGGPWGAAASATTEVLAQTIEPREDYNWPTVGVAAVEGAIPFGRTASLARGAAKGATMAMGGTAARQQTEQGLHVPTLQDVGQIGLSGGIGAATGGAVGHFTKPKPVPVPEPPIVDPGTAITRVGEGTDLAARDAIRRSAITEMRKYRANPDAYPAEHMQALADNLTRHVGTPEALQIASDIYKKTPDVILEGPFQRQVRRGVKGQRVMTPTRENILPGRAPEQIAREGEAARRAGLGSVEEFHRQGVGMSPSASSAPIASPPPATVAPPKTGMFSGAGKKRGKGLPSEPFTPKETAGPAPSTAQMGPVEAVADVGKRPFAKMKVSDLDALAKSGNQSAIDELTYRGINLPPAKKGSRPTLVQRLKEETGAIGDVAGSKARREQFLQDVEARNAPPAAKRPLDQMVEDIATGKNYRVPEIDPTFGRSGQIPDTPQARELERLRQEANVRWANKRPRPRFLDRLMEEGGFIELKDVQPFAQRLGELPGKIGRKLKDTPNWGKSIVKSVNQELRDMGPAGNIIHRKLARADQLENQFNAKWTNEYKQAIGDLTEDDVKHLSKVIAGTEAARDQTIKDAARRVNQVFDEIDAVAINEGIKKINPSLHKETDVSRIQAMSRFVAQLREIGPKGHKGEELQALIKATPDPKRTMDLVRRQLGKERKGDPQWENTLRQIRSAMVLTKLSNFAVANILGGQTSIALRASQNPKIYIDSVRKALTGDVEQKALTSEAGAILEVTHGMLEEMARWTPTRLFGIKATENVNRSIAAGVGRGMAREHFAALKADPTNALARKRLEDLILEPIDEVLKQGKLSREQEVMAAGRMAEITQGLNVPRNVPQGWSNSHPMVQLATIFKKYAFQGTKSIYDAIKEDPKRNIPLFLFATQAAGIPIGLAKSTTIGAYRAGFEGKDPRETVADEYKHRADYVGRNLGVENKWVQRILDNAFQSFALGLPADLLQAAASGETGVLSAVAGPLATDVSRAMGGLSDVAEGKGAKSLARQGLRALPLPLGGGQAAAKSFTPTERSQATGRRRRRGRRSRQ